MENKSWIFTLLALAAVAVSVSDAKREGKFMNVFQVISFPNGPCEGSGSRNGTCYTEQECEQKGGTNGGSCASGFGVCCTFTVGCGERTAENCTYFESDGPTAGCCTAEICPCNDNICQMRLDFDTFVITGPTTNTNTISKRRINSGSVTVNANTGNSVGTIGVSAMGQCLTDSFSVSNPSGPNPPTICGTNSGEHMYVEMGQEDCCSKLNFQLGNTGNGASIASRSWTIKVTQYSCNYPNLAPQGCTQYFFESTVNNVQSYNYNNGNGIHLANQDQNICVRRERNQCRICWTTVQATDFAVTGSTAAYKSRNGNLCCDYGASRTGTKKGFDCIQIPVNLAAGSNPTPRPSVICGNNSGLKGNTNCSTRTPFQLNFRSDQYETADEAGMGGATRNRGFMLVYIMDSIGCNAASIVG